MARFKIRPFFRRLSSKHSVTAGSTASTGSDSTAATTAPSPSLAGQKTPRKSSSLAKLRDKFISTEDPVPEIPKDQGVGSVASTQYSDNDQTPRHPRRASTSPGLAASGRESQTLGELQRVLPDEKKLPAPAERRRDDLKTSTSTSSPPDLTLDVDDIPLNPRLVIEEPTPDALAGSPELLESLDLHTTRPASGEVTLVSSIEDLNHPDLSHRATNQPALLLATDPTYSSKDLHLPIDPDTRRQAHHRRQSIIDSANAGIVKSLIDVPTRAERPNTSTTTESDPDYFPASLSDMAQVQYRKIWVKRPNASATLVQVRHDDLVDDVRDMILKKYANSLGRTFDAPDMVLRIIARPDHAPPRERMLGPDEDMCRTIDTYYPGGQTVDEALVIDVPPKRTPRPSPRHYNSYAMEEMRPQENGTDYFPSMPAVIHPTLPHSHAQPNTHSHLSTEHPRSISVLNTGQVPPLPSPGGRRHRAEREHRPKFGRQHTSSPTIITHNSVAGPGGTTGPPLVSAHLPHRSSGRPRVDSSASEAHHPHANGVPPAPPLPTPPAPEAPPTGRPGSGPPTPSGGPPSAHRASRPRKTRRGTPEHPTSKTRAQGPNSEPYGSNPALPNVSSMLDGSVPPINVLIVEDNIINLRILEGLMKRLKVRWETAMNGQIAVDKWKGGGYHLVLMDIQMPIMNGLQATKEIRRLERVNGIGVFSSSTPGSPAEQGNNGDANGGPNGTKGHNPEDDRLPMEEGMFKSPIIIVALTASSLQSDRHEALAAGCNDFLTKPVSFIWLERKVKEWGCMQALIDFDGWRKWKDYAAKEEENKSEEQKQKDREQEEKQRIKSEKLAKLQEKQRLKREEEQKEKERKKRESLSEGGPKELGATEEVPETGG